jgi:hypothetical protein
MSTEEPVCTSEMIDWRVRERMLTVRGKRPCSYEQNRVMGGSRNRSYTLGQFACYGAGNNGVCDQREVSAVLFETTHWQHGDLPARSASSREVADVRRSTKIEPFSVRWLFPQNMLASRPRRSAHSGVRRSGCRRLRIERSVCAVQADGARALLFTGRKGRPLRYSSWRRNRFDPARHAAGLAGVTRHDLRASRATWVADAHGVLVAARGWDTRIQVSRRGTTLAL